MSQQLKLLEAYGFLRKTRADRGPAGRKINDFRVMYSLVKGKTWLTTINPGSVRRKELRLTTEMSLMVNLLLSDYKEEIPFLLNFFLNNAVVDHIDSAYYLKSDSEEIHLLVVTKKLEHFREAKSAIKVKHQNVERTIRFWSHTLPEIKEGLARKEPYFQDLVAQPFLLYEKEKIDLGGLQ
jgi:hypothetical protein